MSSDSSSQLSRHSLSLRRQSDVQRRQGIYWIGTIPRDDWEPCLPEGISYLRGQPELGESGYKHWQVLVACQRKQSLPGLRRIFSGIGHWELTRSAAADAYVWKEDTRDGEPFEFGERPSKRNSVTDWDKVRMLACRGSFDEIPSDIFVRHYGSLIRIRADHLQPIAELRTCKVLWGPTGTGKSRTAWADAGPEAYPKDPRSKFWCGYSGQSRIIIDEFRGGIDIAHLLRWLDRYPCRVELKGSSYPLMATEFWITSNLPPNMWYPEIDTATYMALERRLEIIHVEEPINFD